MTWTRCPTIATASFEDLPGLIDQLVAQGLADARAQLERDPFFTAPMLARALVTIEQSLRATNETNVRAAWFELCESRSRIH